MNYVKFNDTRKIDENLPRTKHIPQSRLRHLTKIYVETIKYINVHDSEISIFLESHSTNDDARIYSRHELLTRAPPRLPQRRDSQGWSSHSARSVIYLTDGRERARKSAFAGGRPQMDSNAASFTGSIPENYDRGLGPVIFVDYADDIARRAAAVAPTRVLETAAGTGIVTRRLRDLLPAGTHLTVTDLNPPMLEVARAKLGADEQADFRPADATALPFPDNSFDAIVCQFGLMFFPDKPKSFAEAMRVLAPGGHYFFSVWDSFRYNPFARIAHELIGRMLPDDPPQFYRTPASCHEIDPLKEALIAAGFTDIGIAVKSLDKVIPDIEKFARAAIIGNPVSDQIRLRGREPEEFIEALLGEFRAAFGAGPSRMPLQAIVYTARKPA